MCAACGRLGGSSADRLAGFHTSAPPADSTDRGAGALTAFASTLDPSRGVGDSTGTYAAPPRPGAAGLPPGYEFRRELGVGGMGRVVLAHEAAGDRLVALKFLKAAPDARSVERFAVEFRAAARLDHPNVVRVYNFDQSGPAPFFAMEYVEGASLAHRLMYEKAVPPSEAAGLVRTAARAVAAAHAAGVVHRDLKPQNLMMNVDGVLKVGDFGLAKRIDRDDGMTLPSGLLGTPEYMAPEQCGGRNDEIGPVTDVYGLGATLYHLLTGETPHRGKDQLHTLELVKTVPVVPPRARQSRVPADLEAVCLRAMAKEPAARYSSAEALAADLDRFLAGETPLAAVPPPAVKRAVRAAGRAAWRGRLVVAGLALVALGAVVAAAMLPRRDPPPPDPAEEIRKELKAGRPVTLVGDTGMPKYHKFHLEPNGLGLSPHGDETASFHAFTYALLELCPAPGIDRYQIDLELRHLRPRPGPATADPIQPDYIGVYFGHQSARVGDTPLHVMMSVGYRDAPFHPGRIEPEPVRTRLYGFAQPPDGPLWSRDRTANGRAARAGNQPLTFTPNRARPGDWRPIRIEVTETRVVVRWKSDGGEVLPVLWWDRARCRQLYKEVVAAMDGRFPGAARQVAPDWTADGPFGIISYQSAVSVRKVTIAPIAPPANLENP